MEQKIFQEAMSLYNSSKRLPNVIRIGIRLDREADPHALRYAVDRCAERYPYFCIELKKKEGEWVLAANGRPVVISDSKDGVTLGSEEANRHLMAFSYDGEWINFDISHSLTDGTGAYELVRTLLYYYCSLSYGVSLTTEGIRLCGEEISSDEWEYPVDRIRGVKPGNPADIGPALCLVEESGIEITEYHRAWDIVIDEKEFMRFNSENDGSPGTMTALFLSRAIEKLHPGCPEDIRILLAVNMRPALGAPLAHQSFVGGAVLDYNPVMRRWPLERQATAYRGMVFIRTMEERVRAEAAGQMAAAESILSLGTDRERRELAMAMSAAADSILTAGVSYVGKAGFGDAEHFIRDFRLYTNSIGRTPLIEISAVNGKFILDFIQPFDDDRYLNSFLEELDDNCVSYSMVDSGIIRLPGVELPFEI